MYSHLFQKMYNLCAFFLFAFVTLTKGFNQIFWINVELLLVLFLYTCALRNVFYWHFTDLTLHTKVRWITSPQTPLPYKMSCSIMIILTVKNINTKNRQQNNSTQTSKKERYRCQIMQTINMRTSKTQLFATHREQKQKWIHGSPKCQRNRTRKGQFNMQSGKATPSPGRASWTCKVWKVCNSQSRKGHLNMQRWKACDCQSSQIFTRPVGCMHTLQLTLPTNPFRP